MYLVCSKLNWSLICSSIVVFISSHLICQVLPVLVLPLVVLLNIFWIIIYLSFILFLFYFLNFYSLRCCFFLIKFMTVYWVTNFICYVALFFYWFFFQLLPICFPCFFYPFSYISIVLGPFWLLILSEGRLSESAICKKFKLGEGQGYNQR